MFQYLSDFVSLIFPRLCVGCGRGLFRNEKLLCLKCLYRLPETNYHQFPDNPVEKIFWGRVNISRASSFLFFNKGGLTQKLLHALKYRKSKEAGLFLGELYGERLRNTRPFNEADMIIPVPLHYRKQRIRGYNQSEVIGQGLSRALNIPVETGILLRTANTASQTRKTRFQRWKNVESIFSLSNHGKIEEKYVLLIDDVVTTGATLEACAGALNKANNVTISILTLAYAWK